MMIDRRSVVGGLAAGALCGCCAGIPATAAPKLAEGGCGLPPALARRMFPKIISIHELTESRNAFSSAFGGTVSARDAALAKAVQRLSATFRVSPKFGFFDDSEFAPAGNALAWRPDPVERPNGAVTLGMTLFDRLMREDPIGASVLAVLAHEFAHVVLYTSGRETELRQGRPTAKRVELHADYLAGYYLGLRKRDAPTVSLFKAGHLIWSIGDTAFDSKHHHGTRDERNRAAEAGFKLAADSAPEIPIAFDAATRYIQFAYARDPL